MSADDRFFDADLALRTVQLVLETILRNATTRSCVFIFCTISLWNDAQAAVYQLCRKSSASATGKCCHFETGALKSANLLSNYCLPNPPVC